MSSSARSLITLGALPTLIAPTVTTPKSLGAISRETIPCNLRTIDEASTAGSTPSCGIDPWAPFPKTVTLMLSPADSTGPDRVAMLPDSGTVRTCWARHTSGLTAESLPTRSSSIMAWAPLPVSSPGWNRAI